MQNLWRRNIHIKRFESIPIADTELIFPEKNIFLKPVTILQLTVTIVGGLIAAFVTLWGVRRPLSPATTLDTPITLPCRRGRHIIALQHRGLTGQAMNAAAPAKAELRSCAVMAPLRAPTCVPKDQRGPVSWISTGRLFPGAPFVAAKSDLLIQGPAVLAEQGEHERHHVHRGAAWRPRLPGAPFTSERLLEGDVQQVDCPAVSGCVVPIMSPVQTRWATTNPAHVPPLCAQHVCACLYGACCLSAASG